jgi:hypothetical protein
VTDGLVTVTLDFGAAPFVGNARWLQITAGGNVLSPRQRLNATPYALHAMSGGTTIWQLNGSNAYYNAGRVGIGTMSPAATIDVINGGSVPAVQGRSPWIGVFGSHNVSTGTFPGVWGETESNASEANGVRGIVVSTSPGTNSSGVRGINNGTGASGIGVYGSHAGSGWGVYGIATTGTGVRGQGLVNGVHGICTSTNGNGVLGVNNAASGGGAGVRGESSSFGGGGVAGFANSGTGVYGQALNNNTWAIYGSNGGSNSIGYAGYFNGRAHVAGTLSKSSGSFKIDHPLDPENKFLYHSFVESPDMMNIYNGIVVTDSSGYAMVEMPEWFDALNRDFRYQLTVMYEFAQAIIAQEMQSNQFMIRTDKPNVTVSWQVTGIRQDAYAEAHRIEVEVEKAEHERNRFLHPELYNRPATEAIGYNPLFQVNQ